MPDIPITILPSGTAPTIQQRTVTVPDLTVTIGNLRAQNDIDPDLDAVYFAKSSTTDEFHITDVEDTDQLRDVLDSDIDRYLILFQPFPADKTIGNPLDNHPATRQH